LRIRDDVDYWRELKAKPTSGDIAGKNDSPAITLLFDRSLEPTSRTATAAG
jgi:hypothetical protein